MAQLITVRLNKADHQPLGFRLQGGKDFGTPLVVQKVNGGSAAERAGLQAGDALIRVNATDVYTLRHQEAQDAIRAAGGAMELTVQRGGSTWKPSVTPTGSLPRPGSRPLGASPAPVTTTSLKATPQPSLAFGSGHNNIAKPFGYMNGNDSVKSIVNKQYNTPVGMYSDKTIAETLSAQTEVLAGGVLGVNFKKNEKTYDAEKSAVFKVLQEEQNDPEPVEAAAPSAAPPPPPVSGLRHVQAPVTRPDAPLNNTGGLPPGQNICEECERLITGVFVRIKDKNLHVECFKCSTCGSSLKNQGYYNLNGKLYCDIHAKLVARNNPPAPNLDPVTVPPGGRIPTNTYSTPLPPIATNNFTNGSSSMFSPSSNISGPKPFGSSIGSAYSPSSLSPRSAPMSPARPVTAPAPTLAPAQSLAPPFATTQNVKSIVWPPPNPSEDEPSPQLMSNKHNQEPAPQLETMPRTVDNKNVNETIPNTNIKQQCPERTVASSENRENVSFDVKSAALPSATSSSLKSESIVQSKQSQMVQETSSCTVQSFSAESSTKSESLIVYQSHSLPNESFRTSLENIGDILQTPSMEKYDASASKTHSEHSKSQVVSIYENPNKNVTSPDSRVTTRMTDHKNEIMEAKNSGSKKLEETSERIEIPGAKEEFSSDDYYKMLQQQSSLMTPISNSILMSGEASMVDALTTASDRPFSPFPKQVQPMHLNSFNEDSTTQIQNKNIVESKIIQPTQPSTTHTQQKQRVTPIPDLKTYNPPENKEAPMPLPAETKPYIPPDFKINIEPKTPRDVTSSPMLCALTTAPDRPFSPMMSQTERFIERGSLRDALTIAPDRCYSPLNMNKESTHYTATTCTTEIQTASTDIVRPIATQTSSQTTEKMLSEFSSMQNTSKLQSSTEMSAFRPVAKQVLPQPEEFCKLTSFSPLTNEMKTSFAESTTSKQETLISETTSFENSAMSSSYINQGFSSVKNAQNYFEQLDKKECLSSTSVRSKAGLQKADNIPSYQKNFQQLPSQRGITPELCNAPAIYQRPVTPTTNPPTKSRERSQEPKINKSDPEVPMYPQIPQQTQTLLRQAPMQQPIPQFQKDTPITMTFQPVTDEKLLRSSPARSRPTTPSLINKPAPIIPHYQMNLVTVEHLAPESHLYEPSSPEVSRSPTPKPRSRSPAQGPPPNPMKAQAPRIKETTPQRHIGHTLLSQATSNLRKEHESTEKDTLTGIDFTNSSQIKPWAQDQPSFIQEQQHSNVGYQSESYNRGETKVKKDSMFQQNYGQRQMQSQNVVEHGSTTIQTTKKTFEEFENTKSAKMIEIRSGGSLAGCIQQAESNIRPSNIVAKRVNPPVMDVSSSQQSSSLNITNDIVATASRSIESYQPKPLISGANQGPVCDPTPSTGPSVGATPRGKTFGVSSAPKRGRGVLNKAALPGSRVPLCGSPSSVSIASQFWRFCQDYFLIAKHIFIDQVPIKSKSNKGEC